jgi:hypothetical protein
MFPVIRRIGKGFRAKRRSFKFPCSLRTFKRCSTIRADKSRIPLKPLRGERIGWAHGPRELTWPQQSPLTTAAGVCGGKFAAGA